MDVTDGDRIINFMLIRQNNGLNHHFTYERLNWPPSYKYSIGKNYYQSLDYTHLAYQTCSDTVCYWQGDVMRLEPRQRQTTTYRQTP